MPVPERHVKLFRPELEPGETVRSAANADLWFRYRRLALTDRRLIVVERGAVRHPRGGRRVLSLPLSRIRSVGVGRSPLVTQLVVGLDNGESHSFALVSFSAGTRRFVGNLQGAVG